MRIECKRLIPPAVVGVLAAVMTMAVEAAQAPLPAARDIVARHVAAIGGEKALASIKSMRMRGRVEIAAQGIAGDIEVLTARPAKMLYRVTVPGLGRIESGYDGKIGWSISPGSGPELITGRQLSETADDAWFDSPLHATAHVRELTTLERTEFDGRPAYKVKVVFLSGNEQTEYYDVETGLQIGSEAPRATPLGTLQTLNILRNYKKFGPLVHATVFIQRVPVFEQVMTLTSCEYDVVPDSAFDVPPNVKALIAQ